MDSFDKLYDQEKNKIMLTLVGNGNMKNKILTVQKKNKFIKYYKFLNKDKLNKIYKKSDVFIFPSRFDGWGVAPLEAMSFSNYLILSKKVGMKEIIDKKNKILQISSTKLIKILREIIANKIPTIQNLVTILLS